MSAFTDWQRSLLRSIGAPATADNLRFLDAWQRAEGGTAANNPLNTTQHAPGASAYNSVGVRNYGSPQVGLEATKQTLLNGHYDPIVSQLRSGRASAAKLAQAVEASPWGTGGGVLRVLGEGGIAVPPKAKAALGFSQGPLEPAPLDLTPIILSNLTGGESPEQQLSNLTGAMMASPAKPRSFGGAITAPPRSLALSGGGVSVKPGADRAGVPINPGVIDFARQVSAIFGKPIQIGTGTNHNQFVLGTNRQSAHWTGNAADIPATGASLTRLGQAALVAAGMSPAEAAKQGGGLFNIGRYQVIFNSMTGGNHFNHLHIGLR